MAKHHHALAPEKEREQLEELLDQPIEPGTGSHVVTRFDPDEGEQIIGEASSLLEALRCLARHIARDGADEADVAQLPTSGPLALLELEAMVDLLEGSMEMATSLGDDIDLGAITEQRPELELVVGWEAGSPAHDLAFGIYRASASAAKLPAPAARKVAAPEAPKVAAPAAPADKPTRIWN